MMNLTCVCRLEQRILPLAGGTTESIFPGVENWLQQSTDHWNALRLIAQRKNTLKYRSVVDFLFSETNPTMRPSTFAFYADKGPPLRSILTNKERTYCEARMIVLLEVAYSAWCQHRSLSWNKALSILEDLAA